MRPRSQVYAVNPAIEPAVIRYSNASAAVRFRCGAGRNSCPRAETSRRRAPPVSICAAELMALEFGSFSLLETTVPKDQEIVLPTKAAHGRGANRPPV